MDYAALAAHYERIEATTKRLEMTRHVVALLSEAAPDEIEPIVHLSRGAIGPDFEGIEVGLAEKMVVRVLSTIAGRPEAEIERLANAEGDIGSAAERLVSSRGQQTLFSSGALTVGRVWTTLRQMATVTGSGSQETKQRLLAQLLKEATGPEARYLARTVTGRLRLGVADMSVLDALAVLATGGEVTSVEEMAPEARAAREDARRVVERAYDVTSDLGRVAKLALTEGLEAARAAQITVGVPVRPMLAERLKDPGEILAKMEGRAALEFKYDGLRVQAHLDATDPGTGPGAAGATQPTVRLYSRRLEELTAQFPDLCATLAAAFRGRTAVVEGETVAVDGKGRIRSFQELSRRRGRKTGLAKRTVTTLSGKTAEVASGGDITAELPVAIYLFDCLHADGGDLLEAPYEARRGRLRDLFALGGRVLLSESATATQPHEIEAFFDAALAAGSEGIMAKHPKGVYKAGSRGWQWIKYKADYSEALADSFDLVVVGAFHGKGRRKGWYGALLMAAYDAERGVWQTLSKLGTGFTDEMLAGMKERFAPHESATRPERVETDLVPDVWFRPALVMEVTGAELTLSPVHTCARGEARPDAGLALRFPRFTGRWREDKAAEDATTVSEVVAMWARRRKSLRPL